MTATKLMPTSQAAAWLNISPATLQQYARRGLVPFETTPGGHRRFDLDQVRRAVGSMRPRSELAVRETGVPEIGSVWCWEPLHKTAKCFVRVTDTKWNGEEWWIESINIDWIVGQVQVDVGPSCWNELDRWIEATVFVKPDESKRYVQMEDDDG